MVVLRERKTNMETTKYQNDLKSFLSQSAHKLLDYFYVFRSGLSKHKMHYGLMLEKKTDCEC